MSAPAAAVHEDAVRLLSGWRAPDETQQALQHAFLGFLAARPDACARTCVPGHLTASALVLSHTGAEVLLTLHPKVGRWVQLGGHCEDADTGLVAAALREAVEESGIEGLRIEPEPLHLDVHPITCSPGVPTRHFDVRFLVHAPAGAEPVRSAESADLCWWPVDALPTDVDTVPHLARLALERKTVSAARNGHCVPLSLDAITTLRLPSVLSIPMVWISSNPA